MPTAGRLRKPATQIRMRGCIDLYYNGSSSSGWQRCTYTGVFTIV